MKFQIMMGILFTLLARRKASASYLAAKYGVSTRSIYRYIDEMICAGVPIDIARGASGGVWISDTFKLPKGLLTTDEYNRAIESMLAMNEQLHDPVLSDVIEKLSYNAKSEVRDIALSGNILVDGDTWSGERMLSEMLAFVMHAIENREALDISYVDHLGESSQRVILPHLLILKQNLWYVYAYCKKRRAFRIFKLGRIRSVHKTGEIFQRIEFNREDIPLSFWKGGAEVDAKFEIERSCLPFAEEWLGVSNVYEMDGVYYAEAVLPDDDSLIGKILSAGSGFKVLAPVSLAMRVQEAAKKICDAYSFR